MCRADPCVGASEDDNALHGGRGRGTKECDLAKVIDREEVENDVDSLLNGASSTKKDVDHGQSGEVVLEREEYNNLIYGGLPDHGYWRAG